MIIQQNELNSNNSESSKFRGNIVFRQELKSLSPKCNALTGILIHLSILLLFSIFGIPILIQSNYKSEFIQEYTECQVDEKGYCEIAIEIEKDLTAPIYFYYEIDNFYVNHRDFVKSRIYSQLRGQTHVDSSNNQKCEGAKYVYEVFDNDTSRYFTHTGNKLNGMDYANPCGLIAKNYFNDTEYKLINSKGEVILIDDRDIANDYDKNFMFKRHQNHSNLQWIDVEDEHFIVWMQMESFQNFRKLWGRINESLESGTYKIRFKNQYNVKHFNGRKFLILTNSTPIGMAKFFGYVLMCGAAYSLFVVVMIYSLNNKNKNKLYTIDDLKWN